MPTPSAAQFATNITAQVIKQGMTQKEFDPITKQVVDTGVPSPSMIQLIQAVSDGVAITLTQWYPNQTVLVSGVQTGLGVAEGVLQ
jgi:hypothetical protein